MSMADKAQKAAAKGLDKAKAPVNATGKAVARAGRAAPDAAKKAVAVVRQANPSDAKSVLAKGFDKALEVQAPLARKNVERLRRVNPGHSPAQLIKELDKIFLASITVSGGAAGAAAAVPGAGIPSALVDMLFFTEASTLYVLSLAEVHDLHPEDFERRKLLVMTVLLGDVGNKALEKVIGKAAPHWAKQIVKAIPMKAINQANKVLGPRFITKYGTKQGVLVLSKQAPLGIGAALGAGGNALFGNGVIRASRKIFGSTPKSWA